MSPLDISPDGWLPARNEVYPCLGSNLGRNVAECSRQIYYPLRYYRRLVSCQFGISRIYESRHKCKRFPRNPLTGKYQSTQDKDDKHTWKKEMSPTREKLFSHPNNAKQMHGGCVATKASALTLLYLPLKPEAMRHSRPRISQGPMLIIILSKIFKDYFKSMMKQPYKCWFSSVMNLLRSL